MVGEQRSVTGVDMTATADSFEPYFPGGQLPHSAPSG
jgi:hypothetical protein